jgi:hypothetical protein
MITVTATRTNGEHVYAVVRDGRPICDRSAELFILGVLEGLGVENPQQMIGAARQYCVVEIHEDVPNVGD